MVFKKPYAFFIKYFKVINFILSILMTILLVRLNSLHNVLNDIYLGGVSNYSSLESAYLGFGMYLLLFILVIIFALIIILLKRKDKPFLDYLLAILYSFILIIFFVVVGNLFFSLDNIVVETATLKLYSDISFLIVLPSIYFVLRFFLTAVGFDIKKFNFSKDIIELKQDKNDDEEVELNFTKDSYKYKRGLRRYIREFKYYILENKLIIYIIFVVLGAILISYILGLNFLNSNKVSINEHFNAGTFSYQVNNVYETKYDLNHNIIKDDYKYIIASIKVTNIGRESSAIDFKRIRILYNNEYSYASYYYNKYFLDLGIPYNNETLSSGENKEYLFIFQVPASYKKRSYTVKFYDKNTLVEEEIEASYKEMKVKAKKLDKNFENKEGKINNKIIFGNNYGESFINIISYNKSSIYKYKKNDGNSDIIFPDDTNDVLLILEYDLFLDKNKNISNYFKKDKDFFKNFLYIEYEINGVKKYVNNLNVVEIGIDNRIFISVPNKILDSDNINLVIKFRDFKYTYTI